MGFFLFTCVFFPFFSSFVLLLWEQCHGHSSVPRAPQGLLSGVSLCQSDPWGGEDQGRFGLEGPVKGSGCSNPLLLLLLNVAPWFLLQISVLLHNLSSLDSLPAVSLSWLCQPLHGKAGRSWMKCIHSSPRHRVEISPDPPFYALSFPSQSAPHPQQHRAVPSAPGSLGAAAEPAQCWRDLQLKVYFTSKSDKHTGPGGSVISAELFPADIGLK